MHDSEEGSPNHATHGIAATVRFGLVCMVASWRLAMIAGVRLLMLCIVGVKESRVFQTGWLSVLGLAVEIIGLSFLFFDLLKSKTIATSLTEFHQIQDELEASVRNLTIQTYGGLHTMANFLAGYLSLLQLKADGTLDISDQELDGLRKSDPKLAKAVAFFYDKGPMGVLSHTVAKFSEIQKQLGPENSVEKALELNERSKKEIERRYSDEVNQSAKLRRVIRIGILFVATGATLQFVDLFL